MKRSFNQVQLGEGRVRAKTVLQDEPCEAGSLEQRIRRYQMLANIAGQPELSQCQGADFETMKMYYDGTCWTMEFEAIISTKNT